MHHRRFLSIIAAIVFIVCLSALATLVAAPCDPCSSWGQAKACFWDEIPPPECCFCDKDPQEAFLFDPDLEMPLQIYCGSGLINVCCTMVGAPVELYLLTTTGTLLESWSLVDRGESSTEFVRHVEPGVYYVLAYSDAGLIGYEVVSVWA